MSRPPVPVFPGPRWEISWTECSITHSQLARSWAQDHPSSPGFRTSEVPTLSQACLWGGGNVAAAESGLGAPEHGGTHRTFFNMYSTSDGKWELATSNSVRSASSTEGGDSFSCRKGSSFLMHRILGTGTDRVGDRQGQPESYLQGQIPPHTPRAGKNLHHASRRQDLFLSHGTHSCQGPEAQGPQPGS